MNAPTEEFIPVVKETWLSRRPAEGSAAVAVISVATLLGLSVVYWWDVAGLSSELPATTSSVFLQGEYWRLLTTMAIHADLKHFLSNAIVFGILSYLLYGYFGFFIYPIGTSAAGCAMTWLALSTYPPHTRLVGASGVVYLMAGFWLTLYILLERRISLNKRFLRALGFGLITLVPTAWEPRVSYRTHALGFLIGIAFGGIYFLIEKQRLRSAERIEWE